MTLYEAAVAFEDTIQMYNSGLITVREFQSAVAKVPMPPMRGEVDPMTGLREPVATVIAP